MSLFDEWDRAGYAVVERLLDDGAIAGLRKTLEAAGAGERHALRDLFQAIPAVRSLCASTAFRRPAAALLGPNCFAVRALWFNKTPRANWAVTWHQDLTIAVRSRVDAEGYGPWSEKAGILHVQPPESVLANMVTVRFHLDDAGADNGALRVVPGSHRWGRIPPGECAARAAASTPELCAVPQGGALVMRPLLLHSSAPAVSPARRGVIHVEFAAADLPPPLEWHERVRGESPGACDRGDAFRSGS